MLFLCSALVIYESGARRGNFTILMKCSVVFFSISDQLSYRWFTRSKVLVVSVNVDVELVSDRWSGASLPVVTKWY